MIELFYSPSCPHCPKAKEMLLEVLEEVDQRIRLDELNIMSHEGLKRAQEYGVISVPTIIINRRCKIVGVPSKKKLFRAINHEIMKRNREW